MSGSIWKLRLIRYSPILLGFGLLALALIGGAAAERYAPYKSERML